ncbi:hypothetical protein BU23DRAFT_559677 [Bimuria novae-zelandiae CBS 107.79]|uniref:HECT-type E3 ubiquitin transferase n=1 Tax=Bimuria novae-zelandiae CBS 107.79 TaxID=1447943 RepID=A0A6A5URU4_9PLEO|nr:hypothetical protein BU23DRAFT_559677 [Bimuria novae-zelandiae CBS 107.79]
MTTQHRGAVVDVSDASRILECSQVDRQRSFQCIVRRYISQILYGCTSTFCTTPTCLSCNKRLVSKPFRPPTQLTARALAFYLASQDNPYCRLCPHDLNVDPDTLEIEGADGLYIHDEDDRDGPTYSVNPQASSLQAMARGNTSVGHSWTGNAAEAKRIVDAIEDRRQSRKDPKSLGQNLYDSITMIFAYSKQIPKPSAVFSSLSLSKSPERLPSGTSSSAVPVPVTDNKRAPSPNRTSFTDRTSAQATSSPVNDGRLSEPTSPQSCNRPARRSSKTSPSAITTELSSNGQCVHKIQHIPSSYANNPPSQKSSTSHLNGTFDGTLDGAFADKVKMGATPHPNMTRKKTSVSLPKTSAGNISNPTDVVRDEQPSTISLYSDLTSEILDHLKDQVVHDRRDQSRDFNFVVDFDANRRFRPAKSFVNRSLYYTLSDPETLLKSFRDQNSPDYMYSPLPHLDAHRLSHAFRDWGQRNGALIFDSLYEAVEALFRPPPEFDTQKSPRLKPSRKDALSSRNATPRTTPGRYLSDSEAAHIIMICVHALTSSIPVGWPHTWVQVRKLRGWGVVVPGAAPKTAQNDNYAHPWLEIMDELEYEPAVRLATRLLQAIGTRRCYEHVLANMHAQDDHMVQREFAYIGVERLLPILLGHLTQVEKAALQRRGKTKSTQSADEDPGWTVTATFLEWLRTIIVKQWDGNVEINKWSSIGTAVTLMTHLHANMKSLNLRPAMFHIPYFDEEIDSIQTPIDFVKHKERPNSFHILQHPIFFAQDALVGYFRAINFNRMFKQFRKTTQITNFQSRWDQLMNDPRHWNVAENRLEVALAEYLVLDVSRRDPLEETLDQLWGQEKRKLMKPLKVRIGILEGEVGLDQGGVTYEFFRLILNEAFKPDNGMFTVDPQTGMTWFQPASLEPHWKFEMIGVLFSLAVYNGITLPVTFPHALYDYFLNQEHNSESIHAVDYIADGWPALAKSFREFLAYPGEVADVFMRDYTFSFSAFGQNIDVDMQAFRDCEWPDRGPDTDRVSPTPSASPIPDLSDSSWWQPRNAGSEPSTVTNKDREQYIKDYVNWLTFRSVAPQLAAFTRGFHTCLHPTSLSFFTPETLRSLVEGSSQNISADLIRQHSVQYEPPYSPTHTTISDFWAVVDTYSQEELKRLLEFVTANERIPITGYESIKFEIIRAGGDTERLPTSSTCFRKLWLPEYGGREKLREKLGVAIRNSEGFGIV